MVIRSNSITLCMIVKDEESCLERCLRSVAGLVNEIVVVDTGSSDRTVALAEQLGAKVFFRAWDGDFSAARNYSLEKANGDWILVLDADEALDQRDLTELRALVQQPGNCCHLVQRHYSNDTAVVGFHPCRGEYPQWEAGALGYFESSLVRLFPNHANIRFHKRVYEVVDPSLAGRQDLRLTQSTVRIQHFGYLKDRGQRELKRILYTDLGRIKAADAAEDAAAFLELGIQERLNGHYTEALRQLLKAVRVDARQVAVWHNLGCTFGEIGQYAEAERALLHALALEPASAELCNDLGVVYLRQGRTAEARELLARAVTLNPSYLPAHSNLGDVLLNQQLFDEAYKAFQRVLDFQPSHAHAKAGLGAVYFQRGLIDQAEQLLREAVQAEPSLSRSYYLLSQISLKKQRSVEALQYFDKFLEWELKLNPAGAAQVAQLFETERKRLLAGLDSP